ncbi:MAG: hypothetical protein N2053_13120 [Chitinispirillaceae bacterium]|nr:hypothetical protein [Chitinispirillaceae bacterium]
MPASFTPIEEMEIYCRFCDKITTVHLDRSIAENGRTIDRNSTFEYLCTKCLKTFCFSGNDLLEEEKEKKEESSSVRDYSPDTHFYIGETIYHKKLQEKGVIVGKEKGNPSRILVNFEKTGMRKLIEDLH